MMIIEVALLVFLSAICSGLNIAVMSLNPAELRRKAKLGDRQAKRMLPLRRNAHLSLASILLTNIAVVSATSLILEQRFNGWLAGTISTLLIVIFGEILPQAIFSRNALKWSARFSPVLKAMMFVTYFISKPLQLLLDKLFPRQRAKLQTRDELGLLISEHLSNDDSELDEDEVEIMRGALKLSEKRVRDIMTGIHKVFWLQPDTELNGDKIDEIKAHGFSRIPVFNAEKTICYGILLVKQLVDIDFDEKTYLVSDMALHPVKLVGSMTALDTMFRKFIGSGTHLLPVERDDQIVGVVTIEDLFEEIVGQEIEDETDRLRLVTEIES